MKNPIMAMAVIVAVLLSFRNASSATQPVNAILGDASFLYAFGCFPTEQTDEKLRLATHLSYVEYQLRARDVSGWPVERRNQRTRMLDLLHEYWTAGQFPRNYDHVGTRRPCFIDRDGNICAVGYLVERTVGRDVAEVINSAHKYDHVLEMNDPVVDAWIAESGLTVAECAMIQPEYNYYSDDCFDRTISRKYGIASALIGGTSLSLGVANGLQIAYQKENFLVPSFGLISGGAQVILGAINYPEDACKNHPKENLSIINIGMGTATIGMSIWNLSMKKAPLESRTSWNLFSYPTTDKRDSGVGFSLTRRL